MSFPNTVISESRKLATLPATLAAVAITVVGSVAIAALNAISVRNALVTGRTDTVAYTHPVEAVFAAVPLGTVGAVILGVVAISSEYTANRSDAGSGRQITTTLTATPRRLRLLAAKAAAVVLLVAVLTVATIPAALATAYVIIGDAVPDTDPEHVLARSMGAGLYWALTALIALAVTVFLRSGIIPLIVLIVNSSLVSPSFLLSRLTPVAYYAPDLAGSRLFGSETFLAYEDALAPLTGGLVMAGWALGLLAVAGVVSVRRDA